MTPQDKEQPMTSTTVQNRLRIPMVIAARCETMAAIDLAIHKGADAVELDIHATHDGQLIVQHDFVHEDGRLTNELTLEELRKRGIHAPLLVDALAVIYKRARAEIDLKISTLPLLEQVINAIRQTKIAPDVEITSGHVPLLAHVKRLNPRLRTGMFFYTFPTWMPARLWQQTIVDYLVLTEAQVAHLEAPLITLEYVRRLHALGLRVHGSNLNTFETIRAAMTDGIDQFSTTNLDLALSLAQRRKDIED
jgi:glycerophosphoryl diester phosphodiesterase